MSPTQHYITTGNSDTNTHYKNLLDIQRANYNAPATGRYSTGNILEKRIGHGIIIDTNGKPIDNRNKLCSKN